MPDAIEFIDATQLKTLLQQGSGQGVRVAILDTGIDVAHPALSGAVRECYEVVRIGGRYVCQRTTGSDSVGHGTACAGIIHALAPEAELFSVRVIGTDAIGTGEQLLTGLAFALSQGMDVVNLSLGTVQKRIYGPLHELVDEAFFKGILLVAAANNFGQPSYPADFASLIAVDNQFMPEPLSFLYRLGRPIELAANGIYVRAPCPGGRYQLFTGTSFACPHVTAVVTRLRSVVRGLTPFQAKAFLWSLRANLSDERAGYSPIPSASLSNMSAANS